MNVSICVADSTSFPLFVNSTHSRVGALSAYSHTASSPISMFVRSCTVSSRVSMIEMLVSLRGSFVQYRLSS